MENKFTELLYQNQGIVHKICNLYFNNRSEKEDYQQELIIQLWKAFPSFNNQSKFSTWMYRVCLNAAIDIIRKETILTYSAIAILTVFANVLINDKTDFSNFDMNSLQAYVIIFSVIYLVSLPWTEKYIFKKRFSGIIDDINNSILELSSEIE